MSKLHNYIHDLTFFNENVVDKIKEALKTESVNKRDYCGRTALHQLLNGNRTLSNQERTVLSILLQKGGDLMEKDNFGNTGYHYLAKRGESSFFEEKHVHLQNNKGFTPLFFAVFQGHVQCVHDLIELGAKPFHQDKTGKTIFDLRHDWDRNRVSMENYFVKNKMMKKPFMAIFDILFSS